MVWLAFFGGVFVGMLLAVAEFFYGIVESARQAQHQQKSQESDCAD